LQQSGGDNGAARYPGPGQFASVPVQGKANKLRIVIVPYAYGADGSNRVPDTSPAQVQKIRDRFYAMYPVSDVEITVHEAVQWTGTLDARGNGWQQLGLNMSTLRGREVGNSSDVYYYAMFNPAASIQAYCGGGCLLGVTLLNRSSSQQPAGNPQLRLALGVGFNGFSENTAAHEIGHAHGREHAPCAPGNQIDGVDPRYPHAGARLGDWGYDLATKKLQDPGRGTDIMSYCTNQFVSDYTYKALFERNQLVNQPSLTGALKYQVLAVDGAGNVEWGDELSFTQPMLEDGVKVSVTDADGRTSEQRGQFYSYDHLPGGWLLVPVNDTPVRGARFELESHQYHATR
jgi:hypothetical protein